MCLERTTEGSVGVDSTDGRRKTVSYVRAGHWEGTPSQLRPASFDGSGSSRGGAKLAYIRVGRSKHNNSIRSERYDGHRRWKVWCMIVAILKVTRYLTGSQCSFWSVVVMCDLRSSPSASQMVAFCACWSAANIDVGRLARTALQ